VSKKQPFDDNWHLKASNRHARSVRALQLVSKLLKSALLLLAAVITTLLSWCGYLYLAAGSAPEDHLARKGNLVAVEQLDEYPLWDSQVREFRLVSDTGMEVEIAVRYPARPLAGRPLLLMMGGQETGRAAVDVIPDTQGVTLAAVSYPFGVVPHRHMLDLLLSLRRIQSGIFDTPAVVLLALDYLLGAEAGLAPERVELAGISFGAYLAAAPATLDQRVQRLWLIHGGAAVPEVLDHVLRKRISWPSLRKNVAWYLAAVAGAGHLGPERWVHRFSPRPLVLVHASGDSNLPPAATRALGELAQEPVEVLWTPGGHVHPKRPDVVEAISDLLFDRIAGTATHGALVGQN
jgi:hypothetical protein